MDIKKTIVKTTKVSVYLTQSEIEEIIVKHLRKYFDTTISISVDWDDCNYGGIKGIVVNQTTEDWSDDQEEP